MNDITYTSNKTLTLVSPGVITVTPNMQIKNIGIALYNKNTGEYKSNIQIDDISMTCLIRQDAILPDWDDDEKLAWLEYSMDCIKIGWIKSIHDDRVLLLGINSTEYTTYDFPAITAKFYYNGKSIELNIVHGDINDKNYNVYIVNNLNVVFGSNIAYYIDYVDLSSAYTSIGSNSNFPGASGDKFVFYNNKWYIIPAGGSFTTSYNPNTTGWILLDYSSCTVLGHQGWLINESVNLDETKTHNTTIVLKTYNNAYGSLNMLLYGE